MHFVVAYSVISILIAAIDLLIAARIFVLKRKDGQILAWSCVMASLVDLFYLVSILSSNYSTVSLFSSLYFFSIDIMLYFLAYFVWHYVRANPSPFVRKLFFLCTGYLLFEFVIFTVNPFREIVCHYVYRDAILSKYSYQLLPLGQMHLLYDYLIVLSVLVVLISKALRVPRSYRRQYFYSTFTILTIVAVNAIFLFLPDLGLLSLLDVSIWGYSVACFFLYWCFYGYTHQSMLNGLKRTIFENIDQGIVLFDYEDHMILFNSKITRFFPDVQFCEGKPLRQFLEQCGIDLTSDPSAQGYSLQCYTQSSTEEPPHPLRCDYRVMLNKREDPVGKLFVFADAKLQTDLLTGYHNWDDFRNYTAEKLESLHPAVVIGICDITGLALINSSEGHDAGDQAIKNLSDLLRSHFKRNSYYIRGKDAHLIVLCYNLKEADVLAQLSAVSREFSRSIEYATAVVNAAQPGILDGVNEAEKALHNRKLLNKESIHYQALTSLLRSLQECDSNTEEHVQRTQMMCECLAIRLKLPSVQISNLALLALLHDIGKIGVPLEILNKPGTLSPEEWQVIKSHAEKGYQIAMSSPDLACIADMIRHHHERWDGTGYPDGLSRESIPLLSRIISVVDSYDAMVNHRPYRRALSPERAMDELRSCAGTQFDPAIVSAFIQMLQDNPVLMDGSAAEPAYEAVAVDMPERTFSSASNVDSTATNVHSVHYSRYQLDDQNRIIAIDPVFTELTGYTEDDIADGKLSQLDLIPPEDRTQYLCALNEQLAISKMAFFEHPLLCKNGSKIYVFCIGRIYFDSITRQYRSEIIISSITSTSAAQALANQERHKSRVRLEQWENTFRRDSLTGLLNHAAYISDVEEILLSGDHRIMLLMMDVDNFKEYNDSYGHRAGDEFLIMFSQILGDVLPAEDLLCRMGGDEFSAAISLPANCSAAEAEAQASMLFDRILSTLHAAGSSVNFSMGMALSDETLNTFDELYETADRALYHAKAQGKARLSFASQIV